MVATPVTSAALAAQVWPHRATTVRCRAGTKDQKCRSAFILNPPRRADPAQFARCSCSARTPAAYPCLAVGGVSGTCPMFRRCLAREMVHLRPSSVRALTYSRRTRRYRGSLSAFPIRPPGCRTTWRSRRSLFPSFFSSHGTRAGLRAVSGVIGAGLGASVQVPVFHGHYLLRPRSLAPIASTVPSARFRTISTGTTRQAPRVESTQ